MLPAAERSPELKAALGRLRAHLVEVKCDCRGCTVCHGATGMNALHAVGGDAPATDLVPEAQDGWPPLAGDYRVLSGAGPVAVCTLTDRDLSDRLAAEAGPEVAIVGPLQTENLGIERVIANIVSNPNIRFLVLCGADSRGGMGHLPGQSFLSLARRGIDGEGRIAGAKGRMAAMRNISREIVQRFRRNVEVIDLIGTADVEAILDCARDRARLSPGRAEGALPVRNAPAVRADRRQRMGLDPLGYFLIFADRRRDALCLEHYTAEGILDCVIEGADAEGVYCTAIGRNLVSRLDHAAYLGCELARAERALRTGEAYAQDASPSRSDPGAAELRGMGGPTAGSGREARHSDRVRISQEIGGEEG
jgi:tetrahydromethanopterin S-methyltransferase subunit A